MKYSSFLAAAAIAAITPQATQAQVSNAFPKVNKILKQLFSSDVCRSGMSATDGTSQSTTKPCHTTTYAYDNGNWQQAAVTKTEYNTKGNTTATETVSAEGKTRTEYTYDDTYQDLVTKTTSYSWDETAATWTSPVVTSQTELTKNDKGRVTKEIEYVYDEDSKQLVKEAEINFGYSLISGQMNSIKLNISEEEDDGTVTEIPVTITILKWHNYNADKLFSFSLDDMGASTIDGTDNQIENATISMSIPNVPIPLTGTIKGKYEDKTRTMTFDLMSMLTMTTTMNITDDYGSNETTIDMEMNGKSIMNSTVKNTNNEHGDCIKTETTGSGSGIDLTADTDDSDTKIDLNQTVTYDYEYTTLPDNSVVKQSMVTNVLDKTTNQLVPTTKITFDQYIDYVTGVTGIGGIHSDAVRSEISGIYSINGTKVDNIPTTANKELYIVNKEGKTIKVAK